uniref:Probable ATP-dependent RNA helicase DDX46 (inferred by orthology to a zebrafish protein) n=1 Tax=Strongyloides venezuelensis TaxID=75913 RepID=A0A0K0F4F3_STRVS
MGDSKEEINNVLSSSKRQIATRVTMPQRFMYTGIGCGHANEITFNIRQPPTKAMNDTKSAMINETSKFTSNAPQNNMISSGRMPCRLLLHNLKIDFEIILVEIILLLTAPDMLFLKKTEKMLNTITVLIRLTIRLLSLEQSMYLSVIKHLEMQTSIHSTKRYNQIWIYKTKKNIGIYNPLNCKWL